MADFKNEDLLKEWFAMLDKYSTQMENNFVDAVKQAAASPAFQDLQQKQMEAYLTSWEHLKKHQDQFFRYTGIASQDDIARLGQMIISLENKIDQINQQLEKVEEEKKADERKAARINQTTKSSPKKTNQ